MSADDPAYRRVGSLVTEQYLRTGEDGFVQAGSHTVQVFMCLNCCALVAEDHRSPHGQWHIDTGTTLDRQEPR